MSDVLLYQLLDTVTFILLLGAVWFNSRIARDGLEVTRIVGSVIKDAAKIQQAWEFIGASITPRRASRVGYRVTHLLRRKRLLSRRLRIRASKAKLRV